VLGAKSAGVTSRGRWRLEPALGKQTGAEVIDDEDPARLVERLIARYVTSDYVCPCRPSAAV
jgi:hypothetical protein